MTLRIQPALQNQHRGDLVDDVFPVAHSTAGGLQMSMRFGRAQALIPQMHRQTEFFPQSIGKLLGGLRARTAVARQMNRPAYDNRRAMVAPQQTPQRTQIISPIGMNDGQQRLRRQPQFVGDGDPNPPLSVIQAENARWRSGFHVGDGNRNARRSREKRLKRLQ